MESNQYADDRKRVNINDQECNIEERPTRKLHNFNLPGLSWANQRLLTCVKMEDIEKIERMNNISIPRMFVEANKPNQTPQRIKPEKKFSDVKCKSKKSHLPIIISDDSDEYTNGGGIEAEKEDDEKKPQSQNEDNESLPLQLRTRRAMAARGLRIEEPWKNIQAASDSRPRRSTTRRSFEDVHGRHKFSLTLSKKEIEDDFIQMTGNKPPKKPTRRTRAVQNYIDSIFPGLSLTEITLTTYKIRDGKK